MFESAINISGILIIAIIICFLLVVLSLRKAKRNKTTVDFDRRVNLYDESLSPDQRKIKEKLGAPLEIRHQDSIDNIISIWVYPEEIISFNQDGSLRKFMK